MSLCKSGGVEILTSMLIENLQALSVIQIMNRLANDTLC